MTIALWVIAGGLIALVVAVISAAQNIECAIGRLSQRPGMTPDQVREVTSLVDKSTGKLEGLKKP